MNLIEISLSFAEGLALIASPCILPVLPLVLSASAQGGKKRPFGIITGFVLAFSLFALASRKIVLILGIDLDIIKDISLVMLLLFGLILLSGRLSEKFSGLTQGAANVGGSIATGGKDGFFSGMLIGSLIGLVWTPCAGPILAAVLVQVIRQQTDIQGIAMIVAFALGAGVPMFAIAIAGRKVIDRLGFLKTHSEAIRKAFGVLIIVSVGLLAFGGSISLPSDAPAPASSTSATQLTDGLATPYPAPEFAGIDGWLNSQPLTMASLKGKVVLVDFWTYSCINCLRTLPYITKWDQEYRDKGLVIIGVHSPEFEFEKKIDNVKKALEKYGIHYPVALDNNLATWQNFKNAYWPAHYLIDREGKVVYTHFGEGGYDITENNIRYLLGLTGKTQAEAPAPVEFADNQTPETYVGSARSRSYKGTEPLATDHIASYHLPEAIPQDSWALGGSWKVENEKITSQAAGATLALHFNARKVFLVLGTATGKPVHATVKLNGVDVTSKDVQSGKVEINTNRLYELIDQPAITNGRIDIITDEPGIEAYAFTFGG